MIPFLYDTNQYRIKILKKFILQKCYQIILDGFKVKKKMSETPWLKEV